MQFENAIQAADLAAAARWLRERFAPAAAVVGYSSVLMLFADTSDLPADPGQLTMQLDQTDRPSVPVRRHEIDVSFEDENAPELALLGQRLAMTKEQIIEELASLELQVRFMGFRPGFAYLDGLPAKWDLPRRSTSRARVPSGSFGIASGMAGFYPEESPGGWNIIGRSDAHFWDAHRHPPALLSTGDIVRIRPAGTLDAVRASCPLQETSSKQAIASVIAPGQQTLVVVPPDFSRCAYGLPAGGAFDPQAAARANLRAGNPADAAVLECALVGPELRFELDCSVHWEGARVAWQLNGQTSSRPELAVRAGDILRIGRLSEGLRGWLAIHGGVEPSGSRFEFRPAMLRKGDILFRAGASGTGSLVPGVFPSKKGSIRIIPGPHPVASRDLRALLDHAWIVTPSLDRTAIRLQPEGERTAGPASIPSCGMQPGTAQLHPNGDLLVMGPDHPVTGGYLQPFTVTASDHRLLAQLQPGERIEWKLA